MRRTPPATRTSLLFGFFKDTVAARRSKELHRPVPGREYLKYLYEIGADALKRRKDRHEKKKLEDEVKEMIAAKADAAKQAVAEAAPVCPSATAS
jgi:hypothetical protein